MKSKGIYIVGPADGDFDRAEAHLNKMYPDIPVYNNKKIAGVLPEKDGTMYFLSKCDTIYLLSDWEEDIIANRQYGYAVGAKYHIWKERIEAYDNNGDGSRDTERRGKGRKAKGVHGKDVN